MEYTGRRLRQTPQFSVAGCLGKWADLRNRMERMHVISAHRGAQDDGRAVRDAIDDEIHDSG
jgi:hypothetical protein